MTINKAIYLLLIYLTVSTITVESMFIRKVIIVKYVRQCEGKNNLPIYTTGLQILQSEKNEYRLKGEFHVEEKLAKGFRATVEIRVCSDVEAAENCQMFMPKFKANEVCSILNKTEGFVTTFLEQIDPRPDCPFYGIYKLNSIPIDTSVLNYIPVALLQTFQLIARGYVGQRMVMCVNMKVQIKSVRSRT